MTRERAEEILDTWVQGFREDEDAGDWWDYLGDVLNPLSPNTSLERQELAEALAFLWRRDADEPGFIQPAGGLVHTVEQYVGGKVFSCDD